TVSASRMRKRCSTQTSLFAVTHGQTGQRCGRISSTTVKRPSHSPTPSCQIRDSNYPVMRRKSLEANMFTAETYSNQSSGAEESKAFPYRHRSQLQALTFFTLLLLFTAKGRAQVAANPHTRANADQYG